MTRIIDRLNSQAAEDKDPKAVRPDIVGKRQLAEHIVQDRKDPVPDLEEDARQYAIDQDRYLRSLTPTEGKSRG